MANGAFCVRYSTNSFVANSLFTMCNTIRRTTCLQAVTTCRRLTRTAVRLEDDSGDDEDGGIEAAVAINCRSYLLFAPYFDWNTRPRLLKSHHQQHLNWFDYEMSAEAREWRAANAAVESVCGRVLLVNGHRLLKIRWLHQSFTQWDVNGQSVVELRSTVDALAASSVDFVSDYNLITKRFAFHSATVPARYSANANRNNYYTSSNPT